MENSEKTNFPVISLPSADCLLATSPDMLPEGFQEHPFLAADFFSRSEESLLVSLERVWKEKLLVPEVWREILPTAGLMISSSLSGGTLQQRLEEAAQTSPNRCWMRLERLSMRFTLPCPTGTGKTIPRGDLDMLLNNRPSFFSPELCCRYCYDLPDGMILYDTDETWSQKLLLAQSAGFVGALVPASSEI